MSATARTLTSAGTGRLQGWFELGAGEATRVLPMKGLRGLAVGLVFLVHFASLCEPYLDGATLALADSLHTLGNTGVDLFFVLSGYLIYGTLIRRHRPFPAFIARRIQRLYPSFLLVLAIYLALSLALPAESKLPAGIPQMLAYVLANVLLLPGIFDIIPIITVAWSLSYEMFFYLTIPLLIGVLGLRGWPRAARVGLFLGAVVAAQVMELPHPRIGMFVCGMLLSELLPSAGRVLGRAADPLALLAVLACGAIMLTPDLPAPLRFASIFAACFLLSRSPSPAWPCCSCWWNGRSPSCPARRIGAGRDAALRGRFRHGLIVTDRSEEPPMPIETWLAFMAAAAILLAIPGPTILLVISYALGHGKRPAAAIVAGVALGDLTAMTASMAGLGAILATSSSLFTALRWVGAAYLVYLGIRLWRAPVAQPGTAAPPAIGLGRIFGHAYAVTALNPKSIVFFVAFVPQFLSADRPVLPQVTIMLATFVTMAALNATLYALLASSARGALRRPAVQRTVNRTGGGLLIGAGLAAAAWRKAPA